MGDGIGAVGVADPAALGVEGGGLAARGPDIEAEPAHRYHMA